METTDTLREAANSLLIMPEAETEVPEQIVEDAPETEAAPADIDETEQDDYTEGDETEVETDVPGQPALHRVKVDGREVEVTLEELTRGYAGQAYIQQGMKKAAEARKEAETLSRTLQEEQQRFLEFAQQVQTQGLQPMPQAPNPSMSEKDPIGYMKARAQYDGQLSNYYAQQSQIAQFQHAQAERKAAENSAMLQEQMEILQQKIPDLADPEKGKKVRENLIKTGRDYGFSDADIEGITDARAVQVLHDAAQWRALQARTAKAKVEAPAPRNVKPSAVIAAPKAVVQQKLVAKAKRTGDLRDWARTLLE